MVTIQGWPSAVDRNPKSMKLSVLKVILEKLIDGVICYRKMTDAEYEKAVEELEASKAAAKDSAHNV